MDALALLCNLYGDGPATLTRLRLSGVERIEDLQSRSGSELAVLLALPQATARRFLKEATSLKERVLDPASAGAGPERTVEPPPRARQAPRGKQALLEEAARRWNELEERAPEPPMERKAPAPARSPGTPLSVECLGRTTHDALQAAGIATLEELLERDGESLAGAARLGLSQVLFAQGMARRRLREQAERKVVSTPLPGPGACAAVTVVVVGVRPHAERDLPVKTLEPAPRAKSRFSPSERPPLEWLSQGEAALGRAAAPDEGAGPFA